MKCDKLRHGESKYTSIRQFWKWKLIMFILPAKVYKTFSAGVIGAAYIIKQSKWQKGFLPNLFPFKTGYVMLIPYAAVIENLIWDESWYNTTVISLTWGLKLRKYKQKIPFVSGYKKKYDVCFLCICLVTGLWGRPFCCTNRSQTILNITN